MTHLKPSPLCFVLALALGCDSPENPSIRRDPIVNLDVAAKRLSEIANAPAREYSTQEFGRVRYSEVRSVVVRKEKSHPVLERIRGELGLGLVAFIGTTQWLGDEVHTDGEEIVVAPASSQFDILRVAHSDAVNYDMETEDLIKKLTEFDRNYGIDIFHAETDTIEFKFLKLPNDMPSFCKDLYEFCPDIVDQGVGSLAALELEIQRTRQVFLWWD